jgi:hypothetical protein
LWLKSREDITEMNMEVAVLEKAQDKRCSLTTKVPPVEGLENTISPCCIVHPLQVEKD